MLVKFFAYIPAIIGIFIVFLIIMLNNYKAKLNQLFLLLSGLAGLWLLSLFIADTTSNNLVALYAIRFGVLLSTLLGPVFLLFSRNFPREHRTTYREAAAALAPALILGLLAITPYMVNSIAITTDGAQLTATSFLYSLDSLAIMAYFLLGTYGLVRKRVRSAPVQRTQIDLVLIGILVALLTNFVTGYVLALMDFHGGANLFGASSMFIFSAMVAYTMVRHQLFDIRLVVARSVAYLLSLATLGAAFTGLTVTVTNLFFSGNHLNNASIRSVYTVLAIGLALLFPPLKRFFDKVTNRVFFRDSYDTQAFLDDFNKLLVATYELAPLLKKSAKVIEDNLKPTYTVFGLKETESAPQRILGTAGHPPFTNEDIAFVRSQTPKMKRKLIVTDLLEEKYGDLQRVLQANNIAVIARLASSTTEEGIGYLVLGPKKSGNLYSSQDLKVIEIVANELVIAIQNALRFEEIENFNRTLQAKVDDATRKLRATNEKLKQLDETKDDFISMASHQLRTPLTSVKGYISMVLEGDAGKLTETQRKLLEQSFFSSQRMVYLIADLLNVSRLKTGKFIIEPAPVNLAEMVEQEMEQLKETAAAKGLTLTYDKPKEFPALMLDETKTRQVIMNFADNAIYYTPAGGHIRVELMETPASVELRVVDDGIGVPKHEQHHLFTKFYRAGNARKARPDGTGLGLFMAKKVVAAQGGAIIFESTEGKGSTFGFVFSKAKLAPGTPQAEPSQVPAAKA